MKDLAKKPLTVLVADDDEFVREHVVGILGFIGLQTVSAKDGREAISLISPHIDAAIIDLDMPGATGLEVLAVAVSKAPGLPVIILSGAGEVQDAVLALKRGAFDYITKPFDPDELHARVREAVRVSRLEAENAVLRSVHTQASASVTLIAKAPASRGLVLRAERCAVVDSTVLITGPSGTGKSVLARWIHQRGDRADQPFVSVNCGALPRELIDSELFGHEKGAFTGATSARIGRFEAAEGGTLFLDEIGELPLDLQPKLLNAIQDRAVTRLGAAREVPVNVRLIAATNTDLYKAIEERTFREDLFYRLNVLTLEVPALRARPEDIVPLAQHTIGRIAKRLGIDPPAISPEALRGLEQHAWPGNVRELENVLERAMVFAADGQIGLADLGLLPALPRGPRESELIGVNLADLEKRAILATLSAYGGNRAETALALGVSERTIYNRLKEYGRSDGSDNPEPDSAA